jgi:hypothetical protein
MKHRTRPLATKLSQLLWLPNCVEYEDAWRAGSGGDPAAEAVHHPSTLRGRIDGRTGCLKGDTIVADIRPKYLDNLARRYARNTKPLNQATADGRLPGAHRTGQND